MTATPKGFITIAHEVLGAISQEEIIAALPEEHQSLPRQPISISPQKIQHGEAMQYDWRAMLLEQERLFNTKLKPLLDDHPDYEVLYFGLASIPMAVHLGHKLSSFRKAKAFLKDHTHKNWQWSETKVGDPLLKNVPKEVVRAPGDVIVRFGTRFEIHEADTTDVVPNAIKEIELYPPDLGGDLFGSYEQMALYASAFRDAMDAVASNLPEVRDIHLFAAIPVGMAFLIGQEISPTAHPLVHVYEYSKDHTPHYYLAYTVNQPLDMRVEVDPRKRPAYQKLREEFQKELQDFQETVLEPCQDEPHPSWFHTLFPDESESKPLFETHYWSHLKPLHTLPLKTTFLDATKTANRPEHDLYYFTNAFLQMLSLQLKTEEERCQALRLFCFHVTINQKAHRIQSEQSDLLYDYPRVLEEIDYQADVYALLHEFRYGGYLHHEASQHFGRLINGLLQTLWAFDVAAGQTQQMDVHRVNRYLTWYYLVCLLETGEYATLPDVLQLLSAKPLIELKTDSVRIRRNKAVFDFKSYDAKELGICLFHDGHMKLQEVSVQTVPLSEILEGFKHQEPDRIKEVLQALITQTHD